MSPGSPLKGAGKASLGLILIAVVFAISGKVAGSVFSAFASWPLALLLGLLFPAFIAYIAYGVLLPARSAQGSALALRTESFRRFLHASEAQHVEWAWKHDLLREYSGWAVALGEADAWADALDRRKSRSRPAFRRCRRFSPPHRRRSRPRAWHRARAAARVVEEPEAAAWVAEEAEEPRFLVVASMR